MFDVTPSSIFCCKCCGCCRRREYKRWEVIENANEKIRIMDEKIDIMNALNSGKDAEYHTKKKIILEMNK